MSHHQMQIHAGAGDEHLLVCPEDGCGRRLVIKPGGEMVVLDQGDFFALHSATTAPIRFDVSVSG